MEAENAALAERRRNASRRQEFLVRNLEQDFLMVSGNLTANILATATGLQSLEQTPQVQQIASLIEAAEI